MKMVLYIVILALLFLAPVKRLDVAKLEPVQTVAIYMQGDSVVLETDTGNKGEGVDTADALENLEEKTPGVIYLDTAQYLLVSEQAVAHVDSLRKYLTPAVSVCMWDGEGSVKSAAKYLAVRDDLPKIKDWKTPEEKAVEKS